MIIVMIYDMIDYTSQIVITSTDFSDRFLINFVGSSQQRNLTQTCHMAYHIYIHSLPHIASIIAIITITIVIVCYCYYLYCHYFHYHYYDHNTYIYIYIHIHINICISVQRILGWVETTKQDTGCAGIR
jgi:hypothetical protein